MYEYRINIEFILYLIFGYLPFVFRFRPFKFIIDPHRSGNFKKPKSDQNRVNMTPNSLPLNSKLNCMANNLAT